MFHGRKMHPSAAMKCLICSLLLPFVGPGDALAAKQMGRQHDESSSAPHSVLSLQVALGRVQFSPGPIDGKMGSNTQKALRAFKAARGLQVDGFNKVWAALGDAANLPLAEYVVTEADVAGPFQPSIPESLEDKAKLEKLSYTGQDELLAG